MTNGESLRSRWDSYEPRAETPALGSTWVWEPNKPHAREHVEVIGVDWNGEEWWVKTHSQRGDHWNDLSRFWEACWPDPDPNNIEVGQEITWRGPPCFQRALPGGWQPSNLGSRRDWSKIGEDRWRRLGHSKVG